MVRLRNGRCEGPLLAGSCLSSMTASGQQLTVSTKSGDTPDKKLALPELVLAATEAQRAIWEYVRVTQYGSRR